MIEIRLEGEKMTEESRALRHINKRMDFEDDCTENLDELWESLIAIEDTTVVTLYDKDIMLDALGQFGYDLLDTFEDADKANSELYFESV